MKAASRDTVLVTVELFGHARHVFGHKEIEVQVPTELASSGLATALDALAPSLRGVVVDDSGQRLMASYAANLNGLAFLENSPVQLEEGDRIFVFSSQAGG